jgi:hypothetical protein
MTTLSKGNRLKRFVGFIVIGAGALLVLCVVTMVVWTLALDYRFDRQNRKLVQSISEKLAPVVVRTPKAIWDTDLHPYGFPVDSFDSPYLDYTAPATVAMSDSLAAVTFHKSSYAGNQLIQDVHLITLSIGDGSLVTNTQWPEQGPLGLGPGIFCCTKNDEFYAHADGWLLIKNGGVVGKQEVNPVGPNRQKINVSLGNSNRPATVEIVNEDGSKNTLQSDCGNVGNSFLSKNTFVIIGCNTLSVIDTAGHLSFSDAFSGADLKFGGASRNGKRFVISVSAWCPGDPPYLTDEWLVVYDTERRAPIFAVKSDPLAYVQSQSALSADGSYLLAGSGGHLRLIKVLQ